MLPPAAFSSPSRSREKPEPWKAKLLVALVIYLALVLEAWVLGGASAVLPSIAALPVVLIAIYLWQHRAEAFRYGWVKLGGRLIVWTVCLVAVGYCINLGYECWVYCGTHSDEVSPAQVADGSVVVGLLPLLLGLSALVREGRNRLTKP